MAHPDKMEIRKPKILLGEGKEEVFFFEALLDSLDIADVQAEHYGGKANLGGFLAALRSAPGFDAVKSIGVTRDADADASAAFASVKGALSTNELPAPDAPLEVRQCQDTGIRVSVFILPDSESAGMLESLCLSAISDRPEMDCVEQYFECVTDACGRTPARMAKARCHAWLATHEDPELRLGEAAQRGYWPLEAPAFGALREFLAAL